MARPEATTTGMTLEDALLAALDDEHHARAYYRAVLAAFGPVRPFANIVESEQRHIEALERLCRRYGVVVPADAWPERIVAPESLLAACEAARDAEVENAALYERLLRAAEGRSDVQATFRRLRSASQENHLPAFERAVARESGGRGGRGDGRGRRHRHRGGGARGAGRGCD